MPKADRAVVPALAALVVGVVGCHPAVDYTGRISFAPAVTPTRKAPVMLLLRDTTKHQARYSKGPLGYHVVTPSGGALVWEPGCSGLNYTHTHYWPPKHVFLGAFIDLNGNGELDHGEPWGRYRANPLRNPVPHHKGTNTVDIVIAQRYRSTLRYLESPDRGPYDFNVPK